MDDIFFVGRFDRFADLFRNVERFVQRQRSTSQFLRECLAFNQLQDQELKVAVLRQFVDTRDVGVIE